MAIKNFDSNQIPESFLPFCPVQKTIAIIQAKWALFILSNLLGGKKRFGELRRSLNGVSPKTLSLRLKELEDAGILKRTIFAEVPPRVEYELTEKGASLGKVIEVMSKWGEKWMPAEPARLKKSVVNIRGSAPAVRGRASVPKESFKQGAA
jgi:DNA-binding HxlR family transcriptional regulator